MKLFAVIAAALVATAGVVPLAPESAAGAQTTVVRERTTTVTRTRPGYAPRRATTTRRVCTNRWRNGHRQRVCRTVRVRR